MRRCHIRYGEKNPGNGGWVRCLDLPTGLRWWKRALARGGVPVRYQGSRRGLKPAPTAPFAGAERKTG